MPGEVAREAQYPGLGEFDVRFDTDGVPEVLRLEISPPEPTLEDIITLEAVVAAVECIVAVESTKAAREGARVQLLVNLDVPPPRVDSPGEDPTPDNLGCEVGVTSLP